MALITKMLKQKCVRWPKSGTDEYGKDSWGTAVEVSVRWEAKNQLVKNSKGEEKVSSSTVYVASDVVEGDWLWLGTLTSLPSGSTDPRKVVGAYQVLAFNKTPNMKATLFLRTAYT
jgi:hypothetical protein